MALIILATPALAAPQITSPPAGEGSQIWGDPALPGTPEAAELAARGYAREELFLSGEANIYGDDGGGGLKVEQSKVPYTTRLIVIRPKDPARFSGAVQLNPFHPVNGTGVWNAMRDYVLAAGDAYVGVMIGGDATTRSAPTTDGPVSAPLVLPWFDPVRYGPIRWPEDDGVRWDVFAQTAAALKGAEGPLGPLKAQRIYASGWSFTGSFLRTFINEGFHERLRDAQGGPVIDGYLIGISSSSFRSGYVPINSRTPLPDPDDPRRRNRAIDAPVIELMSENEAITNREPQTPDSDGARRHRLYELPGTTHGSGGRAGTNVIESQRARRLGRAPAARAAETCPYPNTDIDISHFGRAALANLDLWVREGTPPPRAERLRLDDAFRQVRDENGNALGGVRPAQLEAPLARYGAPPEGLCPARQGLGSPSIPMRRMPLPPERIAALYPGGQAEYLARFDAQVDRLLAERWLLPPDGEAQKRQARSAAEAVFGP